MGEAGLQEVEVMGPVELWQREERGQGRSEGVVVVGGVFTVLKMDMMDFIFVFCTHFTSNNKCVCI